MQNMRKHQRKRCFSGCEIRVYLEGKFNIPFPYTEVKREKDIHLSLRPQQGRLRGIEHEPTVNQVDATGCER